MLSAATTATLAVGFLALELLAAAAIALRTCRRSGFRPAQYPVYLVGLWMTRVRWRARICGRLQLPVGGGAVVVCNHRGPIDPAFVGLAVDGPVHWMVAREYFDYPFFGPLLRHLEAVPTGRRGVDTAATRQILRYVRGGALVGVFPEGRINTTDEPLLPVFAGATVIALKARVPIIPCYIAGSPNDPRSPYGFLRMTARTTLYVGAPLDVSAYYDRADDRDVQELVTRRTLRAVAALGGYPDYEPRLIGRRARRTPPPSPPGGEVSKPTTSPD